MRQEEGCWDGICKREISYDDCCASLVGTTGVKASYQQRKYRRGMSRSLNFLLHFDFTGDDFLPLFFERLSSQHNDKAYGAGILSDKKDQHDYGASSHQTWAFAACAVLSWPPIPPKRLLYFSFASLAIYLTYGVDIVRRVLACFGLRG